jgi:mono/diheme cytochrome c family protein
LPPSLPRSFECAGASCLVLIAACDVGNTDAPARLDAAALRTGAAVYEARCASCHGSRGEGAAGWTRPGPGGVYPAPPHDSTGHTWHHADGLLYRIVTRGTAAATGDTLHAARYAMPGFDSTLSPREIHAVITYLKAGWTPAQRRRQAEASRADPFPEPFDTR